MPGGLQQEKAVAVVRIVALCNRGPNVTQADAMPLFGAWLFQDDHPGHCMLMCRLAVLLAQSSI